MNAQQVREKFLKFFENKKHTIVSSAPIVVKDDPTLMFTNAGMNQFKDFFLGNKIAKNKRIVDTQKCLRVSGKHNDLEEVGVDTYHHTMFEMLGNWSFGDFFKQEAIDWAWEFLVEELNLEEDRLYATIFEGYENDGLEKDIEAFEIWKKHLPENRILDGSKKDNFWEMGDTGPCGPCSEIHIDLRTKEERAIVDGATLVNADHPQVIEIWNLVFIQYNRKANGQLELLPDKHVDTGMGFERLVRAVQQKTSNYDTDVFMPFIHEIEKLSGKKYGVDEPTDIAFRVIADHIRAISFTIADGQLPSNNGAGYVIRRILRRAVRYGFTFLGFERPFMASLVDVLEKEMGATFPELTQQKKFITKVITEEEAGFFKTLSTGLSLLDTLKKDLKKQNINTIPGEKAFELYDTYGFPVDLTQLIAAENNLKVDMQGFEKALEAQKARSRNAEETEQSDWTIIQQGNESEFVGYDQLTSEVRIMRYRKVEKKGSTLYHVVLDKTPFYAEGGGQVGDTGYLQCGEEKLSIIHTFKENQLMIHVAKSLPNDLTAIYEAVVSNSKRQATQKNHSATHLLHEALRAVLGTHVEQRGSLVNEKYLRFDFSHFQKMTDDEISAVETRVNEKIWQNISLTEKRNTPIEEAKNMGAMALFGEKYGDSVRVIQFGSSVELCGGTHVQATGEIGLFKIVSESSIAAGVRRVEAVTGKAAFEYFQQKENALNAIHQHLKAPKNVVEAVEKLTEEVAQLKKEAEQFAALQAQQEKQNLLSKVEKVGDVNAIIAITDLKNSDNIKNLAFQLKNEVENLFLVLGAEIDGKALITVAINDELSKAKNLHAGNIVRELAKEVQGGGGGQPFYATAGGKNPAGLEKVMEIARGIIFNC